MTAKPYSARVSTVNKREIRQGTKKNHSIDANGVTGGSNTQPPRLCRENGWIKLLRIIIYFVSVGGVVVGASLIKSGNLSASYADGTYANKVQNGQIIFFVFLLALYANIMWGILRWFLRGYREKWRPGRTIGKLIGGGIWRTLVFVPLILISAFLIAPSIDSYVAEASLRRKPPMSLSEQYDELKSLNESFENLNFDDIKEELCALLFCNVDFGLDANSNVSSHQSDSLLFTDVYAYSPTVTTLNKAKLSDKGNFVIFYTDIGNDAISDEQATKLANMLEDIITGYYDNLGFKYEYEPIINNESSISRVMKVLEGSGLDGGTIGTAMPVYVVNPYKNGSNTLASYAGRRFEDLAASILLKIGGLIGVETAKLYNTTPSYPFINILPKNITSVSLPIVTAHELGHHYAAVYNYNTFGKTGSDDDFIDETAPNWMAINVLPSQPSDNLINSNHYNDVYLSATNDTISKVSTHDEFYGYPAVAFLQNYYEIVPDAKTIIMDAVYYGDALNYLYDHAGADNFRKVMIMLAERNLTGDYGGKLENLSLPIGEDLLCRFYCTEELEINAASTEYIYYSTDEYLDTIIEYHNAENEVSASLLGQRADGGWEQLFSDENELRVEIDQETAKKYRVVALAVANYSITNSGKYTVVVTKSDMEEIIADDGAYKFGEFYKELDGNGCYEIDTDKMFDDLNTIIDAGSNIVKGMHSLKGNTNPDARSTEEVNDFEGDVSKTKESLTDAKRQMSKYKVVMCAAYIDKGADFNEARDRLRSSIGDTLNLINIEDGDRKLSGFVGFNLLTREGKIYILGESEGNMGLITINISER